MRADWLADNFNMFPHFSLVTNTKKIISIDTNPFCPVGRKLPVFNLVAPYLCVIQHKVALLNFIIKMKEMHVVFSSFHPTASWNEDAH